MAKRKTTEYVVLTCSGTEAEEDIGLKELDLRDRRAGWLRCLYHFVIRRDGTIQHGHRHWKDPAMGLRLQPSAEVQSKNINDRSVSICLVGGKGDEPFTQAQELSVADLIRELRTEYPEAKVSLHHDIDFRAPHIGFTFRL